MKVWLVIFTLILMSLPSGVATADSWWNTDWKYRQSITMDYSPVWSDWLNREVIITLDETNFNFRQARPDGLDMRFVDNDQTILPYRIYQWGSESATIGVKPAHSNGVTMYWGNPNATDNQSSLYTMVGTANSSIALNALLFAVSNNFTSPDTYGHSVGVSGATWTSKGLYFDGVNDVVTVPDNNLFSFTSNNTDMPFSLITIVNSENLTAGDNNIVAKISDGTWQREWQFTAQSGGFLIFYLWDTNGGTELNRIGRSTSGEELKLGQTYQLVVTYDGSGSSSGIKIYKNTIRVDNGDMNSGNYTGMENLTGNVEIGSGFSPNYNWKGTIGDVQIVRNHALTEIELEQAYLETMWRFSEAPYLSRMWTSTIVKDGTSNGWGDIETLNGNLIAVYPNANGASIRSKVSKNGGKTWGKATTILDVSELTQPARLSKINDALYMTANTGVSAIVTRSYNGQAWSVIGTATSQWSEVNFPSRIVERDGLYYLVAGESPTPWNPNYDASVSVITSSNAVNWGNETIIANGQTAGVVYDETNLVKMADNNILAVIRRGAESPYFFLSTYNGTGWSTPAYHRLPGSGTAMLLQHSSGLLIAQVRRYAPYDGDSLKYSLLYSSADEGETWTLIGRVNNHNRLVRDGGLVEFPDGSIGVATWEDNPVSGIDGYFQRFKIVLPNGMWRID